MVEKEEPKGKLLRKTWVLVGTRQVGYSHVMLDRALRQLKIILDDPDCK